MSDVRSVEEGLLQKFMAEKEVFVEGDSCLDSDCICHVGLSDEEAKCLGQILEFKALIAIPLLECSCGHTHHRYFKGNDVESIIKVLKGCDAPQRLM